MPKMKTEPPAPPSVVPGWAGTGILAVLWTGLPVAFGGAVLLLLEPLGDFLRQNLPLGWAIYLGAFTLGAGFGLVPTYALSLLGGWVFGPIAGTAGALLGCAGASAIGYGISRRISQASLAQLASRHPKARAVYQDLVLSGTGRSTVLVAVLRLPPQSPFALTNLIMGAAAVPFRAFLTGTLAGMAPRTVIAVVFASAGAATGAKSLQEFLSSGPGWPTLALGFAAMVLSLTIVTWLGKSALSRMRSAGPPEPRPTDPPIAPPDPEPAGTVPPP